MELVSTKTKDLTRMAIISSLICLATYLFKIPSINGYMHLGDSMIFIAVLVLGSKKAALSGGIGAALADFLGGYAQWILPTFFIKFSMAMIMGFMTERVFPTLKNSWIIGAIIGGIFQILAYTIVKIPLVGLGYALSSLPNLVVQNIGGIIIAAVLIPSLLKSGIIKKIKEI